MFTRIGAHHRLKALRVELDKSQDECAAEAGIHKNQWSRYERGDEEPRGENLQRIINRFGDAWLFPPSAHSQDFQDFTSRVSRYKHLRRVILALAEDDDRQFLEHTMEIAALLQPKAPSAQPAE